MIGTWKSGSNSYPERLDDREAEDQEAPEGEEVRGARGTPLQQLALAEDLDDLGLDPHPASSVRPTAGCPERITW